ncbi:hypothetical protein HPB47_014981, partial [Ixodes persulcatus]
TLPNKTILCTFGVRFNTPAARPKEGLCDIIIWDFFYASERGTFLNRSSVGLQWFLEFARNDSGATQFGIGIDHGNALGAYDDLNEAEGMSTFADFWKMNIRHYGLLKFQVHPDLVTKRSTVQDYGKLFKRLRDLQEVNRAGDVKKFGYIILGVGLFAPNTSKVYDYLEDLLRPRLAKTVSSIRYGPLCGGTERGMRMGKRGARGSSAEGVGGTRHLDERGKQEGAIGVVPKRPVVGRCIVNVRALDGASVCVDLDCSEDSSSNEPVPLSLDWVSSSKKLLSASSYLTLRTSSRFVCARWLNDSD